MSSATILYDNSGSNLVRNYIPTENDSKEFIKYVNDFLTEHQITSDQNSSFAVVVGYLVNILAGSTIFRDLKLGFSVENEIVLTRNMSDEMKFIFIDDEGDFGFCVSHEDLATPETRFGQIDQIDHLKELTYELIR